VTITVGGYVFEGPLHDTDYLENRPGLYAVHVQREEAYSLIDIGEAEAVRDRVRAHSRYECWMRNARGGLILFSVYYTPHLSRDGRLAIEHFIRTSSRPACGESESLDPSAS
jgi:hypothetical protein